MFVMSRVQPSSAPTLTIRLATDEDATGLTRLAALDSTRPPLGPTLVAIRDGRMLAARSLSSGRTIADPFHPTADLVDLLRLRAESLSGTYDVPARRSGHAFLRRRPAAA